MIQLLAGILMPFSVAVAAALLLTGYDAVGDGFSAGAIVGLGAVAQFVCLEHERARLLVRAELAPRIAGVGLLLVLGIILAPLPFGLPPVSHLPRPGEEVPSLGALKLHTSLPFDVGVALVVYGTLVITFDRLFPALRRSRT